MNAVWQADRSGAAPGSVGAVDGGGAAVRIDVATRLPSEHGLFELIHFTYLPTGEQHLAIARERSAEGVPLVRLHSECATGDAFASLRCDCGPQLHAALRRVGQSDRGYVLYLRQEGRGIGLLAKLRAYALQDAGADTVDANLRLGLPSDARSYAAAIAFLHSRNVRSLRLMTNNPHKVQALVAGGLRVEREPLFVPPNPHNRRYIRTKQRRMGHWAA